jgi:hypothetical protein
MGVLNASVCDGLLPVAISIDIERKPIPTMLVSILSNVAAFFVIKGYQLPCLCDTIAFSSLCHFVASKPRGIVSRFELVAMADCKLTTFILDSLAYHSTQYFYYFLQ